MKRRGAVLAVAGMFAASVSRLFAGFDRKSSLPGKTDSLEFVRSIPMGGQQVTDSWVMSYETPYAIYRRGDIQYIKCDGHFKADVSFKNIYGIWRHKRYRGPDARANAYADAMQGCGGPINNKECREAMLRWFAPPSSSSGHSFVKPGEMTELQKLTLAMPG